MNIEFEETEKILIVKDTTASINVDPQKGFTPLCPDELPVPDGDKIVDELNGQNSICNYKLVSKDVHPQNGKWIATSENPQFSPVGLLDVDVRWNRHCQSGTRGMELLDGLPKMTEYDFFVGKGFEPDLHPYSACYHNMAKTISTGIIEWLNTHRISTFLRICPDLLLNRDHEQPPD
jgi:nicotinamidase/pyrazinamidase